MRKIWDWFHEWFIRDAWRDELADDLNAWGVGATLAERGRHEEALKRRGDSRGLIDITQGPVKWINVVMEGGGGGTSPNFWYVFGIPNQKGLSPGQEGRLRDMGVRAPRVEFRSVRRKRLPVFGAVEGVEWKGNDGGSSLISALSMAQEVEALCKRRGDLRIRLHHETFQGWTVEMKKGRLSRQDWATVETIARLLLSSG